MKTVEDLKKVIETKMGERSKDRKPFHDLETGGKRKASRSGRLVFAESILVTPA